VRIETLTHTHYLKEVRLLHFADRFGPKREATAGFRRPPIEEASSGGSPAPTERRRPWNRVRSGASCEPLLAANEGIFQQPGPFSEQSSTLLLLATQRPFSDFPARYCFERNLSGNAPSSL